MMKIIRNALCLATAAAVYAVSASVGEGVVITVNGRSLTEAQLEKEVAAMSATVPSNQVQRARRMIRHQLVQSFMMQTAFTDAAAAAGIKVTPEEIEAHKAELVKRAGGRSFEDYLARFPLGREAANRQFETGVLIDKMIRSAVAKESVDLEKAADKIIESARKANDGAGGSDLEALAKIRSLKAKLDACPPAEVAAKFAELAKANSDCPSGRKGGDLGFFKHGMMVPEFDKAAFSLPIGKLSDPVKTGFGYHLILVTDKKTDEVRASHILVKCNAARPVPSREEALRTARQSVERSAAQSVVRKIIGEARIEVADEFKSLLPGGSR